MDRLLWVARVGGVLGARHQGYGDRGEKVSEELIEQLARDGVVGAGVVAVFLVACRLFSVFIGCGLEGGVVGGRRRGDRVSRNDEAGDMRDLGLG